MATDIVGGLFGMTPEMYQRDQNQQALAQAAQLGQMDPFASARTSLIYGGRQLGGAIAGALGAEDPQLQRISQFQNLAGQADLTTPEGYINFGKQLMSVDPQRGALAIQRGQQMAQDINKQLTEATLKSAQSQKAMAEAQKIQLDFNDEKVAKETAKKALQAQNVDPTQIDAIVNNKDARTSFLKQVTDKTDTVEANGRVLLINKQTGQTIVDLGAAPDRGTKITMPEIKLPTDINALAKGYEEAIRDDVNVKNLSFNAKGLINQAATSNNPSAWEAARTQVAKAVGEGKLSNEDIARTGVDPTLIGGVRDWIDKKVTGVPDQKTQQALYVVASYLEKNASQRIAEKRNNRVAMAKQVNPSVDAAAMFPDYSGAAPAVGAAPAAGTGKVVDYKDLGRK
jgi:hypothetical protein